MRDKHTSIYAAKPSIEAFALPSELRRTHNFASRARPIIGLDLPSAPPIGAGPPADPLTLPRVARRPPPLPTNDFAVEARLTDDDPPFQPPALWREPTPPASSRRRRNWSERSIAGFLGFAVGLMIVVPLVFVIGANPNAPTAFGTASFELPSTAAILETVRSSELFQALAPQPLGARKAIGPSTEPHRVAAVVTPSPDAAHNGTPHEGTAHEGATHGGPVHQGDGVAARALSAVAAGRLEDARSMLRASASPENSHAWLLLAETYDPNMPYAGEAAGAADTIAADIEFARFYYRQALTYGQETARARLAALPGN